jgi:hypothetical protein
MSWEETGTHEYKCPCKQSTYTVTLLSDDWNRCDERWVMNCEACRENYAVYSFWENDSGLTFEAKYWIKKEILTSLSDNENRLKSIIDDTMGYAKKLYLNQWLDSFGNIKSKKQIWVVLSSLFSDQLSLSAFYAHIKNSGVHSYLASEFNFKNLQKLLNYLQIVDSNVRVRLHNAMDQQDEILQVQARLFKNRFK